MTVSKVGSGGAVTGPLVAASTAAPAAPAAGASASAGGTPSATDSYSAGGGDATALDPLEADLGDMKAPPEPPITAFGQETLPKFGSINQAAPQQDPGPGKLQQGQEISQEPPSPPLQKTKWSILTGPPQGDG